MNSDNTYSEKSTEKRELRLVDIPVQNENVALNLMVNFLDLAQKRGCFSFEESHKIWECINQFKKNSNN
jgi:hypothetical protein